MVSNSEVLVNFRECKSFENIWIEKVEMVQILMVWKWIKLAYKTVAG